MDWESRRSSLCVAEDRVSLIKPYYGMGTALQLEMAENIRNFFLQKKGLLPAVAEQKCTEVRSELMGKGRFNPTA